MATTRTYLDYLDEKIDISPANSQEELDAAELMGSLMEEHGLDVQMQEFDAPSQGKLAHYVLYIVMFVGILLAGFLGTIAGAVGLILVAASFVLLAMEFAGRDVLGNIGPRGRSQNVIGVHRATGPLVMKGNRPIVIVAHYDSPNEDLLSRPQIARYQPTLKRATFYCAVVVPICALVQLMGFLPEGFRHIFWIVGILASLPLLAVGVSAIYQKFAPCTTGANDNKASLAAMLGVMDMVRPADDAAKRYVALHPRQPMEELPREELAQQGEEYAEPLAGEGQYAGEDGYYPAEAAAGENATEEVAQAQPVPEVQVEPEATADAAGSTSAVEPSDAEGADAYYPEAYDVAAPEAAANAAPAAEPEVPTNPVAAFFKKASASIAGGVRTIRDEVEAHRAANAAHASEQPAEGEDFAEATAGYPEDFATEEEPQGEKSEAPAPRADVSGAHDVHVRRATPLPAQVPEVDPFEDNVRRGPDFMGSLNILPADCEIVYDNPPRPRPDLSNLPEVPEIPDFTAEFEEKYAASFSPKAPEAQPASDSAADAVAPRDVEPLAAVQPHVAGDLDETRYSPVAAGNPYIESTPAEVDYIHYVTYDEQYPIVEEYEVIEEPKHDEPGDSGEAPGAAAAEATDATRGDEATPVAGGPASDASDYATDAVAAPTDEPAQTTDRYDVTSREDTAHMDAASAVDDSQPHLIDLPEIEPHYTAIDHAVPEVIYEDEPEPEPEPDAAPAGQPEAAQDEQTVAQAPASDVDLAPEQEWDSDESDAAVDEDYEAEDSTGDEAADAEQTTAEDDEFLIPVNNDAAESYYYDAPALEGDDAEKDETTAAEGVDDGADVVSTEDDAADEASWEELVTVGTARLPESQKASGFLAKLKSLFAGHGARQKTARYAAPGEEPLPVDSTADMPVLHLEDDDKSETGEHTAANVDPTQGYEPVSQESASDWDAQPYAEYAEEDSADYDDDYHAVVTDDNDAYDDHDYEVAPAGELHDASFGQEPAPEAGAMPEAEPASEYEAAPEYEPESEAAPEEEHGFAATFSVDSIGDDAPIIEDYEVIDDTRADDPKARGSQLPDADATPYQQSAPEEEFSDEAADDTARLDALEATAHLKPLRPATLRDEYGDGVEPMPTYDEPEDVASQEEPVTADDTTEQGTVPAAPLEAPVATQADETAPEVAAQVAEVEALPVAGTAENVTEPADDAGEPLGGDGVARAEADCDVDETADATEETESQLSSEAEATGAMSGYSFVPNEEVPEEELAAKDASGLDAPIEDDTPAEKIPAPRPIDDPSWGRSEFRPAHNSMARRAVLFDLPDPSEATTDPFGTGNIGNSGALRTGRTPIAAGAEKVDSAPLGTREPIGLVNGTHAMQDEASRLSGGTERTRKAQAAAARKRFSSLFGNREKRRDPEPEQQSMGEWLGVGDDFDAKTDGRKIGDWQHFGEDEKNGDSGRRGDWKGGATTRSGFRVVEGDGDDSAGAYGGQPYDDQPAYDDQQPTYDDQPQADDAAPQAEGYDLYPVDDSAYQQGATDSGADAAAGAQDYAVDGYAQGAAPADAYAGAEVAGQEPTQEDLRQAILGMSNDELLAHDIYFVALGASNVDHAGMKHFLAEHRGDIRGAFLVNLDSVGAGDLVFLTHEGRTNTRRSDRRMGRMLMGIAKDLHIPLGRAKLDWGETDATLAMQNSVRATTLMGMSPDGVPALSATSDDVPENVNPSQVVAVSDLIAELIRRS